MPQMAPISWLIMFLIFSMSFMLFNMLNYYCFNYNKMETSNENKKNNTINKMLTWKW